MRIGEGKEGLAQGLADLGQLLERHGVGRRPRFQAELVFEELVSNVQRHNPDGARPPVIEVSVDVGPKDIVLVFSDTGRPFDPLHHPPPAAASPADTAIGGKGLVLVRKAARDIAYEHSGGRNRLTVAIARE